VARLFYSTTMWRLPTVLCYCIFTSLHKVLRNGSSCAYSYLVYVFRRRGGSGSHKRDNGWGRRALGVENLRRCEQEGRRTILL